MLRPLLCLNQMPTERNGAHPAENSWCITFRTGADNVVAPMLELFG